MRLALSFWALLAATPGDIPAPATVAASPAPQFAPALRGDRVSVDALIDALDAIALEQESSPVVAAEYAAFTDRFNLHATDALRRDFTRVRLVFELTRDGGPWGLRWDITNRKPRSDAIWAQWREPTKVGPSHSATAIAECDELSALVAFLAYRLGVRKVGLFWPVWNHVVAVWTVHDRSNKPVRVVLPTSQVFLSREAGLGTQEFDPWKQKTIYEYRRKDVRGTAALPGELVRRFVLAAERIGHVPAPDLQRARNRHGGS